MVLLRTIWRDCRQTRYHYQGLAPCRWAARAARACARSTADDLGSLPRCVLVTMSVQLAIIHTATVNSSLTCALKELRLYESKLGSTPKSRWPDLLFHDAIHVCPFPLPNFYL